MICNKCGAQCEDHTRFCMNCGSDLSIQEQPANEPAQPIYQAPPVQPTQPVAQPVYQQPPVARPTYQQPAASVPGKGLGIASMVLGIVSFFCFGLVTGLLAIVLGGVSKSKGYKGGTATAGIVCGCIALGLYIVLLILTGSMFGLASSML